MEEEVPHQTIREVHFLSEKPPIWKVVMATDTEQLH